MIKISSNTRAALLDQKLQRNLVHVLGMLDVFKDAERIVVPSGSCCTMIKVFLPELFSEGSREGILARDIAQRTFELSDFLVSVLGVTATGACQTRDQHGKDSEETWSRGRV